MALPMLIVIYGNPLFNNDDSIARWEKTVALMLQNDASNVINAAKAQLQLMKSLFGTLPYEREIFASLKLQSHEIQICLQRH